MQRSGIMEDAGLATRRLGNRLLGNRLLGNRLLGLQRLAGSELLAVLALLGAPILLAGCSAAPPTPSLTAPEQPGGGFTQIAAPAVTGALGGLSLDATPVAAYTKLARNINSCWLRSDKPVLQNIQFHAKTSLTPVETAKISLYEKKPESRRGPRAYTIELSQTMSGSAMFVENHRLDEGVADRLHADLARWAAGEIGCKPLNADSWAKPSVSIAAKGKLVKAKAPVKPQ